MRGYMEDFLLRPTTGKKERHAAEGHHADCISQKRNRHEPAQAAHFPNVLFVMTAVNDRARAEKQQRLEKTMRQQMHHPGGNAAHAERNHHQTQLRYSRVREDAFDISLRYRDERGH